ncbi:MAG: hypothetical protein QM711_08280 [Micropruina sp.]
MTPTRPTDFTSPTWAMPVTITRKMIGAITILINRMKPSPIGLSWAPIVGQSAPMVMPSTMATPIWKNSDFQIGCLTLSFWSGPTS